MTNQNNAAQLVLTDEELREIQGTHLVTIRSREALIASVIVAGRAIEQAVLSKLRAPVASAEVMDALNWVDDFIARCNRDDRGSCESVNVLRRALASAPVADERVLPPLPEHFYSWYWCTAPEDRQRPLMHGEDAPQASEAVRDALMAFDEAMRLCDDFPELQHHRDALLFAVQKARAALSAQAADKPAISSPSSAGNPCPAPVPADPETGNSHTDGGAVYG